MPLPKDMSVEQALPYLRGALELHNRGQREALIAAGEDLHQCDAPALCHAGAIARVLGCVGQPGMAAYCRAYLPLAGGLLGELTQAMAAGEVKAVLTQYVELAQQQLAALSVVA